MPQSGSALRSSLHKALAVSGLVASLLAASFPAHADDMADVTKAVRAGQYADALSKADAYLAKHPRDAQMRFLKGVILNERSVAIETMSAIRKLGVGLSLDDFGTGYSSLSRLAHLPIRELKIDRSFMRDVESDVSARAIVTTVIRGGQSLQLTVVAEGVETQGQLDLLTELGCDVVQGFFYAPALSSPALGRWLLEHSAKRASAMLRHIGRSLSQPPAESSPWGPSIKRLGGGSSRVSNHEA